MPQSHGFGDLSSGPIDSKDPTNSVPPASGGCISIESEIEGLRKVSRMDFGVSSSRWTTMRRNSSSVTVEYLVVSPTKDVGRNWFMGIGAIDHTMGGVHRVLTIGMMKHV